MADCSNSTETQVLHCQSQSPPPELGRDKKSNIIDQLFEDTVPLDDAVSLDGSFDGTPLMALDSDTEVVDIDDTDCIEKEVVLDSEDEGISDVKVDRGIEGNVLGLQCRQPVPPFPYLDDFTEAIDCSRLGEPCTAEFNYIGFEEPRELSQANALDFVDHYLELNMDSSPETQPRNAVRKKVSPASRTKGCQSLAKKIKTRAAVGKDGTFDWVDNDHCGGIDSIKKWTGVTFGLGGCLQRSVIRHKKASHGDSKEASSSENKWEEKLIDLNKEVTDSPCSDSRAPVDIPKEIGKFKQASEMNFENGKVKNSKARLYEVRLGQESFACSSEENASDMFDVGFSTQMAAEAMEALSHVRPTDSSVGDVNQCPKKLLLDSSLGLMKNMLQSRKPCSQKGDSSNPKGIARMSKQRKSSASSSWKSSHYQENDTELKIATKRKRTKSWPASLIGMKSTYQDECSARKSAKIVKKTKEEGAMGKENTKECEDCGSLSIPSELLLGKQCIDGEPAIHQIRRQTTGDKLEEKDGSDNLGERTNNVVKGSIVTYKRKRSPLVAKPPGVLNAGGNTEEEPFAHQRHWMTGGELEETKDGPDNPGERMNVITKQSLITYRRKRTAKVFEVMRVREKPTKLCCNTSDVLRNNKLTQKKQDSFEVSSLTSSLNFKAWSCPKRKRRLRRRPSYSNERNNYVSTPFMTIDGKESYKRPYNKILPKSSLLKELIRLEIQEPKTDFTRKDMRKRRDMANVQVLFSQHLDNDIIKQQKKIMARLGISIASCSMNATHFIADKFARTRNMLEAIALGKPVVTHLWLEICGQASCLIDEKNYILRDAKKEKEIGFSMPASLTRASQHPLLKGRRVLVTPKIKPDKEMIISLVKAVHGQAVEKNQIFGMKISDDLLILSCEEDHSICMPFLNKGAAAYSSELLLNGIVIQKLEYERHQLFTNRAKRN